MQYVNDDMDELFRRAAENYPLDTSGGDWNKVLKALQDEGQPSIPHPSNPQKGKFLWLLLLIPFSFICNENLQPGKQGTGWEQTDNREAKVFAEPKGKVHDLNPVQPNETHHPDISTDEKTNERNLSLPSIKNDETHNSVTHASRPFTHASGLRKKEPGLSSTSGASRSTKRYSKHISGSEAKTNTKANPYSGSGNTSPILYSALILTKDLSPSTQPELAGLKTKAETRPLIVQDKKVENKKEPKKKFYVGVLAGLDATVVKFQKVEGAGYDAGVIVGYEMNPKLAVEGGVFYQEKSYYTDGKYYNTKNIYMPPNAKVAHVSAVCKMIELPLYLKYTFSPSKKLSGYAALGMTSYFMKYEDYSYAYQYSSGSIHIYEKYYKNSSKNILSAIHVSGGISRRLGRNTNLRVEPYIKIPVRSMGYGEMKLLSTGLHVGVVRCLF